MSERSRPSGPIPTPSSAGSLAEVGVLGGSGFYAFLENVEEVPVATPFGPPSEAPVVGTVGGRRVAFVPRHGRDHRYPPHALPYRANLWALRALGVRHVLAPSAVGSLRPEMGPGTVVVPDQLLDRTWGRPHTYFDGRVPGSDAGPDTGTPPGPVVHVGFADPYCPRGRAAVLQAARARDEDAVDGGTLVVVPGPRFSTRAESRWHAAAGGSVVGMTGMPEASLARELALCYTCIALVTDLDAGVEAGEGVSHAEVLEVFARNVERLKGLVADVVAALPERHDDEPAACPCAGVLDGTPLPFELP